VTGVEVVIGNCLNNAIYPVIPQRMRLSGTVTKIWCLKIMGSRPWPFGSRDVIGHVTIGLPGVDFLWVVYSHHVSI